MTINQTDPMANRPVLSKIPAVEIWVGMGLLAAACTSIFLTLVPTGVALFWPGSAMVAAILIRLPRVRWTSAAVSAAASLLAANAIAGHRPWPLAIGITGVNIAEIGLMVVAFRFVWRFPYPHITVGQAAFMTAILGIVIPGIAASVGGLLLGVHFATRWWDGTQLWWSSHTIGASFIGPLIILSSIKELKRLVRRRFLIANVLTLLACPVACYLTIRYVRFPFVSIGLVLLIAAFRLGGFGASIMSCCAGLTISVLWVVGIRPIGLETPFGTNGTMLGLPVVALLATLITPIAVGIGSDARRATARALRVSERRFRDAMAHSPIGMLIANLDGTWAFSNLALQRMLGYTDDEFRAMPPGGPSKADYWRESDSQWNSLLSGKIEFYDVVRSFRHRDGRWVWARVAVSLLRDDEGLPLHLIAQIESLDARRRAEETLAAERERLKITLEAINDAVITTDAATRITYINAAAETLFGLNVQAVENRRVDEVIHLIDPQTSKTAANLLGQSAHHGTVFRREQACLLHRPDGTVCYVTDVVSPVMDSAGVLSGLVIVFRDATHEVERGRELHHRALHDPLTGLSNRTEFDERLRTAFAKTRHFGRRAGVIAIDLDRFKAVNDAAGHAAGDAILCKVAAACREAVRSSDTVARLGGDEFAIILENTTEERANRVAQQLLKKLNPIGIEWQGMNYVVDASLGLSMSDDEMASEKTWFQAADGACYLAKRDGRSRLRVATLSS